METGCVGVRQLLLRMLLHWVEMREPAKLVEQVPFSSAEHSSPLQKIWVILVCLIKQQSRYGLYFFRYIGYY